MSLNTRFLFILTIAAAAALTLSCKKDGPTHPDEKSDTTGKKGAPIEVVGGRVRFYAAADDIDLTGHTLFVNGKDYPLVKDANGDYYTEVAQSRNDSYNAMLIGRGSNSWYTTTADKDVMVPYSQFSGTTAENIKSFPRYTAYDKSTGNLLTFKSELARLDLKISGNALLASVKVRSLGGEKIAGKADYSFTKKKLSLTQGLDHAVVNCTAGNGLALTAEGVTVPVYLAPGDYSKGFEVTLCSMDHKMMQKTLPACELSAGAIQAESLAWAPAGDLLWYEGFDNFVWGGDIIGGEGSVGFSPDNAAMGILDGRNRDGYAEATTSVQYDNPGCGYIQSDLWLDCREKTVATSHVVKDSYITSRNLGGWDYLYHCQEYQGVLAVGTAQGASRGILQFTPFTSLSGMVDVRLSFKLCFQNGAVDDLLFQVTKAGHISTIKVDGRSIPAEIGYSLNTGKGILSKDRVSIPATLAEPKTWHEVEITVNGIADATKFYLSTASNNSGVQGFYIDDIAVRAIAGSAKKGTLRLMYMNIQNGMWWDQGNNYDNFVAWVKRYDPDICVWCEAESLYKTGTDTWVSSGRYLPGHWGELAARYGHNYTDYAKRDDYPQAITTRDKAITKVQTIHGPSDLPIVHGAGHFQVTVNGRKINIVATHLWPKASDSYKPSVYPTGDEYRAHEMEVLVERTFNNSAYSSEKDWILLGDFNSASRLDYAVYGLPVTDKRFLAQNVVLDKTDLQDIVATWYPAPQFVQSTYGTDRRDFIYLSPSLVQNVVRVSTFTDTFTPGTTTNISNFKIPSDHRPFIVDFNL